MGENFTDIIDRKFLFCLKFHEAFKLGFTELLISVGGFVKPTWRLRRTRKKVQTNWKDCRLQVSNFKLQVASCKLEVPSNLQPSTRFDGPFNVIPREPSTCNLQPATCNLPRQNQWIELCNWWRLDFFFSYILNFGTSILRSLGILSPAIIIWSVKSTVDSWPCGV